jgi:hypothetical protein
VSHKDANFYKANEFYNLGNWNDYKNYMKSELADKIKRPTKELFSYKEFNRIGIDRD